MKRALAVVVLAAAVIAVPTAASADDSSYRTLMSANNPDWMRDLPDSRGLAALSIPGTHETMAITGGELTQTQQALNKDGKEEGEDSGASGMALANQLNAGIRMIDIRARVMNGAYAGLA